MTAKRMFERLGYKIIEKNNSYIVYYKLASEKEINFYEGYSFSGWKIGFACDNTFYKKSVGFEELGYITMEENKAIQQQIKELGWEE